MTESEKPPSTEKPPNGQPVAGRLPQTALPDRDTGLELPLALVWEQELEQQRRTPAREIVRISRDLHEAFHAVSAVRDTLYAASTGSADPALREARRRADDAIELGENVDLLLNRSLHRLRQQPDGRIPVSVDEVVEALGTTRTRMREISEDVGLLAARIHAVWQQLLDTEPSDNVLETVAEQWSLAAGQLQLMAANLLTSGHAVAVHVRTLTDRDLTEDDPATEDDEPTTEEDVTAAKD